MRARLLALALVAAACGDDQEGGILGDVQGNWQREIDGFKCVDAFGFEGDTFEIMRLCELNDGSYAAQYQKGTVKADGGKLRLYPEQSSCGPQPELTFEPSVDGDTLTLVGPGGALIMKRLADGDDDTGAVAFGCFDDRASFTPGPVRDI
jgi:hypothetical protein